MNAKMPSVKVASSWWAEKIQNPTFDNGDTSQAGEFANLLALVLANDNIANLSKENIEKFKEYLEESIQSEVEQQGSCILTVDYSPEGILYQAALAAQIDTSVFSWKTMMAVTPEEIRVQQGYGKPVETIYPVKKKRI